MAGFLFKTPDGSTYKYADSAALLQFATQEIAAWDWLGRYGGSIPTQWLVDSLVTPLRNAQSFLTQQPTTEEVTEIARVQMKLYFDSLPPLHPKAPLRSIVDRIVPVSPAEAVYMIATIGKNSGKWGDFSDQIGAHSSYVAGVARGIAYLEGWNPSEKARGAADSAVESAREAGEALTAAGSARDEAEGILNSFRQWEVEHRLRLTNLNDQIRQDHEQMTQELRDSAAETTKSLQEDWKRLTATYDSQLALRAPATYWGKKHRKHTNWVLGLAVGGAAWLIAGALLLNVLASSVFGLTQISTVPSWFQVISFSLGVLVFVLVIRSVLRLMMSHVHLSLDAAERQTMIVSYLSLVRKGSLKEETLEKVLGAIFRPTGDGIVKDDGVPLSVLSELFKKQ